VVKLLCSAGLKPTAASAVRKALAQAAAVRGHHGVVFFSPCVFCRGAVAAPCMLRIMLHVLLLFFGVGS
jgi:hypothetical protein